MPHGHWETTTFTAALRCDGIAAAMVLDGPMNGEAFLAYVEQTIVPELRPRDIVIMDYTGTALTSLARLAAGRSTSTRLRRDDPFPRLVFSAFVEGSRFWVQEHPCRVD